MISQLPSMMPDQHDLLRARFAIVRRDLDQVLARLTDDLLPWAPKEGMRTVQGQLFEIAGKEVELLAWMKARGQGEWVEVEDYGGREASVEGFKDIFRESRQATLEFLD